MSEKLKLKKIETELANVYAARLSLEYRVEQHLEEIKTFELSIEVQLKREDELKKQIEEMSK